MRPLFIPLSNEDARHYRNGGLDAYGLPPERRISDGQGVPCRHSLRLLPAGAPYLIVAHRPFQGLNPYTETGPIFLAADPGPGAAPSHDLPPSLYSDAYIVRGYDAGERIIYGTGGVSPTGEVIKACARLMQRSDVAFVHIRSAANNCFSVRVERG